MGAPRRGRPWRSTAAVALVVLLGGCGAQPPSPPVSPAPLVVHTASPAPEPTLTPTPSPSPTARVPLAAPTHLAIPDLGIDADVEEYTDAQVAAAGGWVDPVHRDVVAWWSGGGTPGDPADNTVYLYGHTGWTEAVFNRLQDAVPGHAVTVTTDAGTLTYAITQVLTVPKADLPDVPEVAAAVPGRLVLVGCHRDPDQGSRPTAKNTVVVAEQAAPD